MKEKRIKTNKGLLEQIRSNPTYVNMNPTEEELIKMWRDFEEIYNQEQERKAEQRKKGIWYDQGYVSKAFAEELYKHGGKELVKEYLSKFEIVLGGREAIDYLHEIDIYNE